MKKVYLENKMYRLFFLLHGILLFLSQENIKSNIVSKPKDIWQDLFWPLGEKVL